MGLCLAILLTLWVAMDVEDAGTGGGVQAAEYAFWRSN